MSALDSDIAFSDIFRRKWFGLNELLRTRSSAQETQAPASTGATAFSVFLGLGIMSAVILVTGYSALWSEAPAVWIHRLMALTLAQSIIIAAIAAKLFPMVERGRYSVRIIAETGGGQRTLLEGPTARRDLGADGAATETPPSSFVAGKLAGREYVAHADGSIEIDTLVGRRRFVSLAAAREFVGS